MSVGKVLIGALVFVGLVFFLKLLGDGVLALIVVALIAGLLWGFS